MHKLALLTLFALPLAQASVVYRSGDWQLDDTSTRQNPQGFCIASTGVEDDRGTTLTLQVRIPKNKPAPVEVLIAQEGRGAKGWNLVLRDETVLSFAGAGKQGRIDVFWGVPRSTQALFTQLEDRREVRLRPADTTRDPRVSFSASGFKNVRAKLQERCKANADVLDAGFESSFLGTSARTINPVAITPEVVTQLREIYAGAHAVHLNKGANAAEMTALRARFATQLADAVKLEADIQRLDATDIPATVAAQGANDARESAAQGELGRLAPEIQRLSGAVTAATGVVERAEAQVAPHRAEQAQRAGSARAARRLVNEGEARINELDSSRASALYSIAQLERERDSAQDAATRARRDLRDAEMEQQRAESEWRAFNPQYELRRRLDQDWEFSRLQRELPNAERDHNHWMQEERRLRAERDQRQRELQACQLKPDADCTGQSQVLQAANNALAHASQQESRAQNEANRIRRELERIRDRAEWEVESVRATLAQRARDAQNRVDQIGQVVNRHEQRVRDISSYEIPRLNEQIISIDRERPQVVSQVNSARPEATRLEAEQAAFERRVGWQEKYQALVSAQSALDARNRELNAALRAQQNANQTVAQSRAERTRLAQVLATQQQQLAVARERLVQVRASLVPFETERSRLETVATQLSGQFADLSAQFAARLPQ